MPSTWICGMLEQDQARRWTARELANHIQEANEIPDYRYAFSGDCCYHGDNSTSSGPSSKRSSTFLEETRPSLVCPPSRVTEEPSRENESRPNEGRQSDISSRPSITATLGGLVLTGTVKPWDNRELEKQRAAEHLDQLEDAIQQNKLRSPDQTSLTIQSSQEPSSRHAVTENETAAEVTKIIPITTASLPFNDNKTIRAIRRKPLPNIADHQLALRPGENLGLGKAPSQIWHQKGVIRRMLSSQNLTLVYATFAILQVYEDMTRRR